MRDDKKEKFKRTADEAKSFKSVSDLNEEQRKKLIRRHQKQLVEEVQYTLHM